MNTQRRIRACSCTRGGAAQADPRGGGGGFQGDSGFLFFNSSINPGLRFRPRAGTDEALACPRAAPGPTLIGATALCIAGTCSNCLWCSGRVQPSFTPTHSCPVCTPLGVNSTHVHACKPAPKHMCTPIVTDKCTHGHPLQPSAIPHPPPPPQTLQTPHEHCRKLKRSTSSGPGPTILWRVERILSITQPTPTSPSNHPPNPPCRPSATLSQTFKRFPMKTCQGWLLPNVQQLIIDKLEKIQTGTFCESKKQSTSSKILAVAPENPRRFFFAILYMLLEHCLA